MTASVKMFVSIFQVALSVAAEFWEQGDLERTVLEQNPIVSLHLVVINVFMGVCVKICHIKACVSISK